MISKLAVIVLFGGEQGRGTEKNRKRRFWRFFRRTLAPLKGGWGQPISTPPPAPVVWRGAPQLPETRALACRRVPRRGWRRLPTDRPSGVQGRSRRPIPNEEHKVTSSEAP